MYLCINSNLFGILGTSHDWRLRCGAVDLYFTLFGLSRPSCLPLPELGLVLNLKEKKAVLNPTIIPESVANNQEPVNSTNNHGQSVGFQNTVSTTHLHTSHSAGSEALHWLPVSSCIVFELLMIYLSCVSTLLLLFLPLGKLTRTFHIPLLTVFKPFCIEAFDFFFFSYSYHLYSLQNFIFPVFFKRREVLHRNV